MLFAVLFEDAADVPADIRSRHMAAHLAFLAETQRSGATARIMAAGPTTPAGGPKDGGDGGLWLVEAADPAAVQALVEADPFWPTGLRKSVRVMAWRQVFADGAAVAR